MIQAVTLDFWNTLVDDFRLGEREQLRAARVREIVEPYGDTPTGKQVARAFKASWDHFDDVWRHRHSTPPTAESADSVLASLGIALPAKARQEMVRMLETIILDTPPWPVEGVPQTLPILAGRYKLAVVCDAGLTPGRVLREVLARHGLDTFFDAFFFSDEHGFSKPDPRAFHMPLTELGVAPELAVHVGDIQRTDIAGAHAAGLRAVHFVGINSSDLKRSSAEAILYRFADLPDTLERLN